MERLIRMKELPTIVGLKESRIRELIAEGRFPPSVPVDGRVVAWVGSEVEAWVRGRIDAARGAER